VQNGVLRKGIHMALKRYKGHFAEGVELRVMGESFGTLKPGESVAVPDELAEQVTWPEDVWEDVAEKAAKSKSKTDEEG